MLRCTMLALLVSGVALMAAEEKTYSIKLKKIDKGNVAVVLVKHESTSRPARPAIEKGPADKEAPPAPVPIPSPEEPKVIVKGNDAKLARASREGGVFLYEETILEVQPGKHPTRLRRSYEQAVTRKDGQETTLPFEWKTLLIEKKDGKYRYVTDDGKELTGDSARTLAEEFAKSPAPWDDNELLLPKAPVTVNETWTIAVEPYVKDLEEHKLKVDAAKCTGKGKLLRVYDKDGRRFGVIEARLELSLVNMGEEGPLPMTVDITLDACIDGSSTDFLRTEKTRIGGEASKQPGTGEGSRQVMRKEIRKK